MTLAWTDSAPPVSAPRCETWAIEGKARGLCMSRRVRGCLCAHGFHAEPGRRLSCNGRRVAQPHSRFFRFVRRRKEAAQFSIFSPFPPFTPDTLNLTATPSRLVGLGSSQPVRKNTHQTTIIKIILIRVLALHTRTHTRTDAKRLCPSARSRFRSLLPGSRSFLFQRGGFAESVKHAKREALLVVGLRPRADYSCVRALQ